MHAEAKRLNDLSERISGAAIDVHRSYLKLSGLLLGLVLNFNVKNLSREGVMRRVNDFPE